MNPIFRREFFARWRDWRSHALLLVLALLLSGAAYRAYDNAISFVPPTVEVRVPVAGTGTWVTTRVSNGRFTTRKWTGAWKNVTMIEDPLTGRTSLYVPETLATRTARAGHALFQTLALGNVAILFVLAPLLTATGVVRERERGLLESLQLSHMSPRSQLGARALSALLFLGALQLVTLPVDFVAFSFGGVSTLDIARSWLLAGATAMCGVGLGLMISSSATRPSGALFGVVALLFVWSALAGLGLSGASTPWGFLGLGPQTLGWSEFLFYAHPVALAAQLGDSLILRAPTYYTTPAPPLVPVPITPVYWTALEVLPLALLSWMLVGSLGLLKASRDVTRAFAPAGWAGRNTLVEKWKRRREAQLELQRRKASARVEGALLADLPFDRLIRFRNPLLNREVKSRFRLRRASFFVWIGRSAVFLVGASAWLLAAFAVFDPLGRRSGSMVVLGIEWLIGVVLVGTFAAAGFSRERESGTWEGVRLSLLSNAQIARTKWLSPLVAFGLWSCPLWLLLVPLLPIGSWNGAPFRVVLGGALAVAASLGVVSALASWVSLRARSTTSATCWTLALLLTLFAGAPLVWERLGLSDDIAHAQTGVPSRSPANWYQPEYIEMYEQDTGRQSSARQLNPNEMADYSEWFKNKVKQSSRVSALAGAWSPVLVLTAFNDNGDNRDSSHEPNLSDNDLALLSLCHVAFCGLFVGVLLWFVTLRLQNGRD